jgi:hypothetical protein
LAETDTFFKSNKDAYLSIRLDSNLSTDEEQREKILMKIPKSQKRFFQSISSFIKKVYLH